MRLCWRIYLDFPRGNLCPLIPVSLFEIYIGSWLLGEVWWERVICPIAEIRLTHSGLKGHLSSLSQIPTFIYNLQILVVRSLRLGNRWFEILLVCIAICWRIRDFEVIESLDKESCIFLSVVSVKRLLELECALSRINGCEVRAWLIL